MRDWEKTSVGLRIANTYINQVIMRFVGGGMGYRKKQIFISVLFVSALCSSVFGIVGETLEQSQKRYGPATGILRGEEKEIYLFEQGGYLISEIYGSDGLCIDSFRELKTEAAEKCPKVSGSASDYKSTKVPAGTSVASSPLSKKAAVINRPTVPDFGIRIPAPSERKKIADSSRTLIFPVILIVFAGLALGMLISIAGKVRKTVPAVESGIKAVRKVHPFASKNEFRHRHEPESRPAGPGMPRTYRGKKSALTNNEIQFHHALQKAVAGRCSILFQVSLGQLIETEEMTYYEKRAARNKIDRKVMDFVLCNSDDLSTIAVIELDDRTHLRSDRVRRDQFLEAVLKEAGIPLVRFWSSRGSIYDAGDVALKINHFFADPVAGGADAHPDEEYFRNYRK